MYQNAENKEKSQVAQTREDEREKQKKKNPGRMREILKTRISYRNLIKKTPPDQSLQVNTLDHFLMNEGRM